MSHDYMTGAELQCLREACGLDRDQFGELCGVQGRSIKYWEAGQSNHGVPADVKALVIDLEAQITRETAAAMSRHCSASGPVVLMRTGDALKNEVTSRVYLALRQLGRDVRLVAFDLKAYRESLRGGRDTPDAREAWARRAVKDQAKPHRADQPG